MDLIISGDEAYNTAKGRSMLNKVVTLDFGGLPDFYNESLSVLVDAGAPSTSSFVASTYGVSTYFMDIGSDCQLDGAYNSWNCSDLKFAGLISQPVIIQQAKSLLLQSNVIKWAVAAKVQAQDNTFAHFNNDSNFAIGGIDSSLFTVMHCETAVYEVDYLKIGDIYVPQSIKPANETISKIIFSPAFPGMCP
jgi:hypothetical protein